MIKKNKSSSLFQTTRWRLATWYVAAISIVLGIIGIGVYEAIIHAHRVTVDNELKTVSRTLHDSLEPILKKPGKLEDEVLQFFPNLCPVNNSCFSQTNFSSSGLGNIEEGQYYWHLFDLSGQLVASTVKLSKELSLNKQPKKQEIIKNNIGKRYLQNTEILHNRQGEIWGYIQVGRSLEDFDNYLKIVTLILLLGLPLAIILIGISAWILTDFAMKPVYRSYNQIQQFTADAAHELRTPLAAIRATLESTLMLPTLTEKDTRETLQTLGRQTQRLSALVSDLLILSRLDWELTSNSITSIQKEKLCLNDMVNDVVEELASLALSSQICLQADIKVTYPIEIIGDPKKLYRLLFNLVVNGIQYTSMGGMVILILEQQNKWAVIKVKDTGIGIDSNNLNHIFDRFYRIDQARSRDRGGSGLGLSIAKAIAIAHHGSIQVTSEVGKGSLFIVRLPLSP